MLTQERRDLILERLTTGGRVLAAHLSDELGVSQDTIRRDLRELDEAGMLRRVHGGALPRQGDRTPFAVRARRAPEAKQSIARRAAACVCDGQIVMLDGGTTTLELARALGDDLSATVVTPSLPVALALADHPRVEVSLVGGRVRRSALVSVGAGAVRQLEGIRADVVFLGVCGLHPESGVTVQDGDERDTKAAMIAGAAEVYGLADHDKLGTALPFVVAPLTAVTHLITDRQASKAALAPYRDAGIEVLLA